MAGNKKSNRGKLTKKVQVKTSTFVAAESLLKEGKIDKAKFDQITTIDGKNLRKSMFKMITADNKPESARTIKFR